MKTLTDKEFKKVKHLLDREDRKYEGLEGLIGGTVFIRTVTHYYTGSLESIDGQFITLENPCWVADTGQFANFMKGEPTDNLETEPMGDITFINLDSVIDISPYSKEFTTQK